MTPTAKFVTIGDNALTLTFNFGTMRIAEKELGEPIYSAFKKEPGAGGADDQYRVSFEALSVIWWAALQRKHRMSRDGADALVDEAGLETVAAWIADGLSEYFGGAKKAEGDADAEPETDEPKAGNAKRKRA